MPLDPLGPKPDPFDLSPRLWVALALTLASLVLPQSWIAAGCPLILDDVSSTGILVLWLSAGLAGAGSLFAFGSVDDH